MENLKQRITIPYQKPPASTKPPNVIIYSESPESVENVKKTLTSILNVQRYTIYPLNLSQMSTTPWLNQATLVVVLGDVPTSLVPRLVTYVFEGSGKLLCICSDLLHALLPSFQPSNAKLEPTTFSYSTWKSISLMRHTVSYEKQSKVTEDQNVRNICERMNNSNLHNNVANETKLDIKVLSSDELQHNSNLLLATAPNGGKVIISQVHLEVGSTGSVTNGETSLTSDEIRVDILKDLLSSHLGLQCGTAVVEPKYTPAYLLGSKEIKTAFVERFKNDLDGDGLLRFSELSFQFCKKGKEIGEATPSFTPILVDVNSDSFSCEEYFENLKTKTIGQLLIHSKVMTSSMVWINALTGDGLAVVPYIQTRGVGRGGNTWLSPEGCAMYSIQLHIPLESFLGERLPLVQHLVTLATVSGICLQPGLEKLDLRLKWPNDIYAGKSIKIGGAVVSSSCMNGVAVCNPGVGFNLFNREPTTCVNEMIEELNRSTGSNVPPISFEKYFAITFTEMERLIDLVQNGKVDEVLQIYYDFWLHSNAKVTVITQEGSRKEATIIGIDEYGYLKIKDDNGNEQVVEHDGNSFDMLSGLIAPKV